MPKGFSSCKDTMKNFVQCVKGTKCVKQGGKLIDCIKSEEAKAECDAQRTAHFICKRSQ
eukprot:jgi/Bigna1/65300/fgenesh1_kg.104_\